LAIEADAPGSRAHRADKFDLPVGERLDPGHARGHAAHRLTAGLPLDYFYPLGICAYWSLGNQSVCGLEVGSAEATVQ
jgi:hypothetical protein